VKRTAAFHQSLQKRPHAPLDIANYLMLSVVTLTYKIVIDREFYLCQIIHISKKI
jgi:hypothetical protein